MLNARQLPVLAALIVVLSLASLLLLDRANSLQQQALINDSAHRFVRHMLKENQQQLESVSRDYGWWDSAILNTIIEPDPDWSQKNLGSYLHQYFNVNYVAVLAYNRQPEAQFREGKADSAELLPSPSLKAILRQAHEAALISDRSQPTTITGLVWLNDELMMAAATPMTQEQHQFESAQFRNYVMLVARRFDDGLLAEIRNDTQLAELHLLTTSQLQNTANQVKLKDITGADAGALAYKAPMAAGYIHDAMVGTFLLLGTVALLTLLMSRRISRLLAHKQQSNQQLQDDINQRRQTQDALQRLQQDLEHQVEQRTEQLKAEQRRLHSILDASADGIITINSRSIIETLNPAAAEMFGYSQEELIGQPVEVLLLPDDRQKHEQYVSGSHLPGKRIINVARQLWARHKNGREFPIDLNVAPIKGNERRFVGVMRDISERVELERAREQAISELRNVLETAAEGYIRVDRDGCILEVNDAVCQMLGTRRQQLLNSSLIELVHPDSLGTYQQQLEERTLQQQRSYELKMTGARGTGHFALKATTIFDRDGQLEGSFAFMSDMTEIRHYQAVLERTRDEAERANRAKSEFLSSMSHELRTPLNAILGFAQLLANSRREPLSERQQTQLKHITQGGQHLLALINEVLDLARIEAGQIALQPEAVRCSEVLDECLSLMAELAREKSVQLHCPPHPLRSSLVRADRTRFRQTLLNLLSNAVKYNRANGSVTLTMESNSQRMKFIVQDTGSGIPLHQQADLFKPFSRLGHENSQIEGTGIGLTITRKLVRLMDGDIGFTSTPDEGSTFWFTLPLANAQPATTSGSATDGHHPATRAAGGQRILYIEDNPGNQQLMQQLLEEMSDYELLLCPDAEQGLELAVSAQPELILMDINLPGIDGFEALARLKQDQATRNIPVVAVSANAMDAVLRKAEQAGFADYLTKPLELGRTLTILEQQLAKR